MNKIIYVIIIIGRHINNMEENEKEQPNDGQQLAKQLQNNQLSTINVNEGTIYEQIPIKQKDQNMQDNRQSLVLDQQNKGEGQKFISQKKNDVSENKINNKTENQGKELQIMSAGKSSKIKSHKQQQKQLFQMQNQFNQLQSQIIMIPQDRISKPTKKSDGNWKQYAGQAYQYYCKFTYATGKNSTFDLIKNNTKIMNISTFAAFCRQFELNLETTKIIQIFKKVTNFKSVMLTHQFISAFDLFLMQFNSKQLKLNSRSKQKDKEKEVHYINSFEKLLFYLHMNSAVSFKNKMINLAMKWRKHGLNARENLIKLNQQSKYKFKLSALNGKSSEQIKEELEWRRNNKQQNKRIIATQKRIKASIDAQKFSNINNLSIVDRKHARGGYISPQQFSKSNSPHEHEYKNGDMNTKSIVREAIFENRSNLRPIAVSPNQRYRNYTQFNTYNNSLEDSSVSQEKYSGGSSFYKKLNEEQMIKSNVEKRKKQKAKGYADHFEMKRSNKQTVHSKLYQLNTIIKQVKQQQSLISSMSGNNFKLINGNSLKASRSNKSKQLSAPTDNLLHSIKNNNINNNGAQNNRMKKNGVQRADKQKNGLQNLIDGQSDQDEYLSKLNRYRKILDSNKKRLATQS